MIESTDTQIPVLTCKVCRTLFTKSRQITLPNGTQIVRFETRAIYCSNACCQRAYRIRKAFEHLSFKPKSA